MFSDPNQLYPTECHRHIWIPLRDGLRLAARLWLPLGAGPVPAIVEYIPYRKSDGISARDQQVHPAFAERGYAALRIDLRGAGDSEGVLADEYTAQEQQDALDALDWIAAQPWCNGAIGMMGISWGGFNSLQMAALRPPALKAIITVGSTDDRYADDVHTMGGCQLSANLTWSQTFFADLSRPPDPAVVGEAWRAMWQQRIEAAHPFINTWAAHPLRDAYWRHGSVCEDFGRIGIPVLAVGGWSDSYTNSVLRLMTGLKGPRKALIGPWGHDYPHLAVPGPAVDFLGEALRWWDRWLKGRENGVEQEPPLRVWLQDELPTDPAHDERPGRWIGFDGWPSLDVGTQPFFLSCQGLVPEKPATLALRHRSPQDIGAGAGEWCAYGVAADQPTDQRADDGKSLCFDTPPLADEIAMIGTPAVWLELAVDRPRAQIAVRLNDIAPDGRSARVSYGVLNLNHLDGHERFVALEPGRRYRVRVALNDIAHRFKRGHRIRVAVSTAYWPTIWPSPEPVTLSLFAGSRLDAPVWTQGSRSRPLPDLPPPVLPPAEGRTRLRPGGFERSVTKDLASGESRMRVRLDFGEERIDHSGMVLGRLNEEVYSIRADDPLSARIEVLWIMTMARDGWSVRSETRTTMQATAEDFRIATCLDLFEGEEKVRRRSWDVTVPREKASAPEAVPVQAATRE